MQSIQWTSQQRQAIETTGRSVLVTAAAGAGKTAVLAQRCAYLVCDAPPKSRCNVDQLLVLTFTNAASAEMRSRIVDAIRQRLTDRPGDARLYEQVALVDAAQISTIHSFCLWMIRRWFSEVGIDPNAAVLDQEEAALLRREVLDELFLALYADGTERPDSAGAATAEQLAGRFKTLVDHYGLGEDRGIAKLILALHAFVISLPDPSRWLRDARESPALHAERVLATFYEELVEELRRQAEHCQRTADLIESGDTAGHFFANEVRRYTEQLQAWVGQCPKHTGGEASNQQCSALLEEFAAVCQEIKSFEFSRKRGPSLKKDTDPAVLRARDAARDRLKYVKEKLFRERLRKRFALFSAGEWIEGLHNTAPYISTIVELVTAFERAFQARKRQLDVLGFADLERYAFELLSAGTDPPTPSEVARSLQRRFAYVLVDEFQDINPIQRSIIELVSREHDTELQDNLFVVGDVKQSIYRFRLAEPDIFLERLRRSRGVTRSRHAIALQTNFRSRPEILDAVNLVFSRLMVGGAGDIVYDQDAELRPGRSLDSGDLHVPIELHLLERTFQGDDATDDEEEDVDSHVPTYLRSHAWSAIEREGYLIGTRIQEWKAADAGGFLGRPMAYRDIAVLLRAARVNAERIAVTLNAMGIPAHTGTGGSLFGALEIRDLLAALKVLDNPQQDIPLAAVLRSGIMGDRFNEDELVEVRCHARDIAFHQCVRAYAKEGSHEELRRRIGAVLRNVAHYRNEFRLRPLADALWGLYERQGFLAYVSGLPNGTQRHANLIKVHEMARRFGTFRRQGLARFLQFVESIEEEGREIATAPPAGQSEDAVRVMSIHQAKGLEFPVVFVAGLGSRFNLGDRSGRMIYERRAGLGLRVVDTDRMLEYPTAAHHQVAGRIEQVTREEELRILYVAMTRARDKLVLVATAAKLHEYREVARPAACASAHGPSLLTIATATRPLDWLMPAVAAAPAGGVRGLGDCESNRPIVDVHFHDPQEMGSWILDRRESRDDQTRVAVAEGRPLPAGEPLAPDDQEVEEVRARIDYVYPYLAAATLPAVVAASDFRHVDEEAATWKPGRSDSARGETFRVNRPWAGDADDGGAIERGLLTHSVLQHLDFRIATDGAGVACELKRMVAGNLISQESLALLDRESIEWFVTTPLAQAMREAGDSYEREFQFVATEPTSYVDPTSASEADVDPSSGPKPYPYRSSTGPMENVAAAPRGGRGMPEDAGGGGGERHLVVQQPAGFGPKQVLIRGVVDGILPNGDGIELVDFKTDRISADQVAQRSQHYRPQMELYARAMTRMWQKPVTACRLVFLSARRIVELDDLRLD